MAQSAIDFKKLPGFKKQFGKKMKKEKNRIPHFYHINATWKSQFCSAELNDSKWLS